MQAVALLRALLTSKTALTDVFISRLEEMQIFVKFPWGKTITVQVVRSILGGVGFMDGSFLVCISWR